MIGQKKKDYNTSDEYREVAVKPAVYTMLAVVIAAALPLGWLNLRIGEEGSKIADTTRYSELVAVVNRDLKTVQNMIASARVDERSLKGSLAPAVTLITPDILPTNLDEASRQDASKFNIELNGIYWSPVDPIVTINDENYKVGDLVQGYRILEIRKTEVVFEDPMGEPIIKYFYDYLGQPGR
jgi:hypothetical protein